MSRGAIISLVIAAGAAIMGALTVLDLAFGDGSMFVNRVRNALLIGLAASFWAAIGGAAIVAFCVSAVGAIAAFARRHG